MKVFISWSGPKSMAVANLLKKWVKYVLQTSSPWISTHDIEQGRVAMTQLFDTLNEAKIGIICLTPRNHEKPWILFEAGAISSKFDESRVLTLLLDGLEVSNLKPPLGLFQATYPTEDGMKSLLWRINLLLAVPLEREIFDQVFQTYWPQFEREYLAIISKVVEEGPVIEREEGEKIDEILKAVRGFDKRVRSLEENNSRASKLDRRSKAIDLYLQGEDKKVYSSADLSLEIIKKIMSTHSMDEIASNIYYDDMMNQLDALKLTNDVREEVHSAIQNYFDKGLHPKPQYSTRNSQSA